jgi:hypothetical protein
VDHPHGLRVQDAGQVIALAAVVVDGVAVLAQDIAVVVDGIEDRVPLVPARRDVVRIVDRTRVQIQEFADVSSYIARALQPDRERIPLVA